MLHPFADKECAETDLFADDSYNLSKKQKQELAEIRNVNSSHNVFNIRVSKENLAEKHLGGSNYIDTDEMILRKGAIAAHAGEKVLIPINMRDGSVIAIGRGNPDWNFSAPHGAGRLMSRTKAKETLDLDSYKEEYSEKDDKFRVGISGFRYGDTVNIGRILSCKRVKNSFPSRTAKGIRTMGKVVLEVTDDRNALERVLLHFAHFAKEAERIDENHYK